MPLRLLSRLRGLTGPALLFVVCVCFCWKLVLTDQYTWLDSPDLTYQVLPWFQFQAGEWHQGRFPLWDPNHWLGQPVVGQMITAAVSPVNWLLFAAPLKHGWLRESAMNWYFVLVHFLAALSMYALCRDLLRSRLASILAGCVFSFGGFLASNDWPCMMLGTVWVPLVLLFLLRATGGVAPLRSAILSGAFLGLSWLAGHHQVPLFTTLAIVATWVWFIFRNSRNRTIDTRVARLAAASLVVCFLISALQTIPAYEYGMRAQRWVGLAEPVGWNDKVPYPVHALNSLSPESILGLVIPGINRNADVFVGFIAIALAITGFVLNRHKVIVQLLATISLISLLLAIGDGTLLHGVLYSIVPMIEKARTPAMAVALLSLGVAALAAFGFDADPSTIRRTALALLGVALLIFLGSGALIIAGKPISDDRLIASAMFATGVAIALLWNAPLSRVVVGALLLCELSLGFGERFHHRNNLKDSDLAKLTQGADIAEYLRTSTWLPRVDVENGLWRHNFGDWYGIPQMGGYLASLTSNLIHTETHHQRTQQLFAVNYFIGRQPRFPDQELVMEGAGGVKLYRNPAAMPRAWVSHTAVRLEDKPHILAYIEDKSKDLTAVPLLENPPPLENCSGDEAAITRYTPTAVRLYVNTSCRAMVVLADTFDPGWKASIDGRPVRMYAPYDVLRGVVVDRGSHQIEMKYRPMSVYSGAVLTAIGFLLTVLACVLPERWMPL